MKPKRSVIVSVRLTFDENEVLKSLAELNSEDKSDILRLPIIDELKRRRQEAIAS